MQMITMDSTNSTYESIEEEMLISVLCALKSKGDVIYVKNANRKETVGISYTKKELKISIAADVKLESSLSNVFVELFKKPQKTSWKRSSLETKLWIYYMVWDSSVCDELIEGMKPNEQYH